MIGRALSAVVCVAVLAGCGGGGAAPTAAPKRVDAGLIPPALNGGALLVAEDKEAREVFEDPGDAGLVVDGRVYTIRGAGDRLVGTLQLSTVRSDVDFAKEKERVQIINGILVSKQSITVGGIDVAESTAADKTVYVWFADGFFQVLQLRPNRAVPFTPEDLLTELIAFQIERPEWTPVRTQADIDPGEGEEEDEG